MAALPIITAVSAAAATAVESEHQTSALNQQADAATQAGAIAAAQGYAREDVVRRSSAQRLGALYAATAQSGIDPNSGSALDVATASATNAEYDALTARYGGLSQRDQFLQRSASYRAGASQVRAGGFFNAFAGGARALSGMVRPTTAPTTFGAGALPFGGPQAGP